MNQFPALAGDVRCAGKESPVTFSSRNFHDLSHDAACAPVYRTPNYERNHSETNHDQTNAVPARSYFASEKSWEFAVEALLFAIIAAISTWPIFAAADAVSALLK